MQTAYFYPQTMRMGKSKLPALGQDLRPLHAVTGCAYFFINQPKTQSDFLI